MSRKLPNIAAVLLSCASIGLSQGAKAAAITLNLASVTFLDGGTASGQFGLNVYGYLDSAQTNVTTTAGTLFPGETYGPTSSLYLNAPNGTAVTLGEAGTLFTLHLAFAAPLTPGFTTNQLVTAAGASYECNGYTCTSANTRYIEAGYVSPVREPATLALFGAGLFGLATIRRRKALSLLVRSAT